MDKILYGIVGLGIMGIISLILDVKEITSSTLSFFKNIRNWWLKTLPAQRILGPLSDNQNKLVIFVRDFFIAPGTPLFTQEGLNGPVGTVPNVLQLWPDVEGKSLAKLLNLFGVAGRTKNIEVMEMGKDPGIWDRNLMILGAQTQKCFDFYSRMQEVAFRMDANHIYDNKTGKPIKRDSGFGYGIIIKCQNPFVPGGNGVGFLLGGYGTLGTEAATYYFTNNIAELGKRFGKKSFGVVVKASVSAGVQSTERLTRYDRTY